ncbi:alpha-E domain-containing protein [Litorimonas sp. RW-G-Af-16]|uniref:alpha-E domain-containing protein n=1 Tax=Litorimonas sp. RW-G-Af-16 TaxID=3241168 RepID=UPI00390CD96D
MLGKTAGSLFWMFRYMERCENTARLTEAGFYIALTRSKSAEDEWQSIIKAAGMEGDYEARHESYDGSSVINYLLRDRDNPASVRSMIDLARSNARTARTALTREVWEAVNEAWLNICDALKNPIAPKVLPEILALIKRQTALVEGTLQGTMLRNDIFDFARLGMFIERADNTARILDVKYHVLLPSVSLVGGSLDNVQWETILRAVSANRSYRWVNKGAISPKGIANFLILDRSMPRSLAFCQWEIAHNLGHLSRAYAAHHPSQDLAADLLASLERHTIDSIMSLGLHEFITSFLDQNRALALQIETDYSFYG